MTETGTDRRAPLLRTKLHRPAVTDDLVPRERLVRLLDRAREAPLTVVSAGAGYGKSTLVSQWIETLDTAHAWVSLDESDSERGLFLEYFLAAVTSRFPDACPQTELLVSLPEPPPQATLLAVLANELDELDSPLTLVLDDYHRIRSDSEVHDLLSGLLDHPPEPLHLVVLARRDPPLPLARLRASGSLVDVRLQDLRFAPAETAELLDRQAQKELSDAALAHLQHEVEGWAVGLRLTALALRHAKDPNRFLLGLGGGVQHVRDYLLDEVVAGLPPTLGEWMLMCSVLDRFCAELCDAVCSPEAGSDLTGREFVDALRQRNLFAVPLDSRSEWFRFHHLVRDLLGAQMERRISPEDVATLHRRASEWFESRGLLTESIRHALASGDSRGAVAIFERHRLAAIEADRWSEIKRWLDLLPRESREERVGLLLAQAWIAYVQYRMEFIPAILEQVGALLPERGADDDQLAELGFFRSVMFYWGGDAESSRREAEEARGRISATRGVVAGHIEIYRALGCQMAGDGQEALASLEQKLREGAPDDPFLGRIEAGQAFVHLLSGDLVPALQCADRLVGTAKRSRSLYPELWGRYMAAIAHLHSYRLEEAREGFTYVAERRDLVEKRAALDSLVGLALISQLLGRPDEAREMAADASAFARETGEPASLELAAAGRARIALLAGAVEEAAGWAEEAADDPHAVGMFLWLENPPITRARAWIARGTPESLERALHLLDTLQPQMESLHLEGPIVEVLVLKSLAREAQGRGREAQQAMAEAVDRGGCRGWVRPFVEAGRPGLGLLSRLREDAARASEVERVLSAIGAPERGATDAAPRRPQPLIDPLTNRELQVLELLRERLSDKEIAARLFISPQTVNFHTKHIYDKLAVNDRRQAVTMAFELGVLER